MGMKARYTNIDGRIVAEKRGGVRKFYASDSLGSTVALFDNTQTKTDILEYWPYGEVRTRTGTNATPFQFGGDARLLPRLVFEDLRQGEALQTNHRKMDDC